MEMRSLGIAAGDFSVSLTTRAASFGSDTAQSLSVAGRCQRAYNYQMLKVVALGALLTALALVWLTLGTSSEPEARDSGLEGLSQDSKAKRSEPADQSRSQSGPHTLPAPVRMRSEASEGHVPAAAEGPSLAEVFESEAVDPETSAQRSEMIRKIVDGQRAELEGDATLEDLDCRSRQCRFKIAGKDQKSVASLVNALQDERGFLGKAQSFTMSRDGDVFQIYLRFAE